jgi:hypothetical protein
MQKEILIELISLGDSTWKISEKLNTTQPNVRYWLKKYGLQTIRKTNDFGHNKLCPKCKLTKSKDDFYKSSKGSSYCKSCIVKSLEERRKSTKQKAVDYLGGECAKCGYNKCIAALDFHHINPKEKDKNYSILKKNFDKLKPELDKCILLCANCHREEHYLSTTDI